MPPARFKDHGTLSAPDLSSPAAAEQDTSAALALSSHPSLCWVHPPLPQDLLTPRAAPATLLLSLHWKLSSLQHFLGEVLKTREGFLHFQKTNIQYFILSGVLPTNIKQFKDSLHGNAPNTRLKGHLKGKLYAAKTRPVDPAHIIPDCPDSR